jgi:hypothetical protein
MNNVEWSNVVRHNATWMTATSPAGTGSMNPVRITVDGIVSTYTVVFSYQRPNISAIASPPFKGGTLQILGTNFGASVGEITIGVDGAGCTVACSSPELLNGKVQCQYEFPATTSSCRGVTVTVDGQASTRVEYCYDVDKGELTGVPAGVQRVEEMKDLKYTIGLTKGVTPSAPVTVSLSTPSQKCTVMSTSIVFPTNANGTQMAVVQTSGNEIDEGTEAVAFTCEILHSVTSTDPQYASSPSRTVTVNVINDDRADVKLWAINPKSNTYDYDVKFLPFYNPEGGSVAYGIRLDSEPRFPVTVRPNISLDTAKNILSPPVLVAEPEVYVFGPSNWTVTQRAVLRSVQDDVDQKRGTI